MDHHSAKWADGFSHAWLILDNNITIDIAADQFGMPSVVMTEDPEFDKQFTGGEGDLFRPYGRMNTDPGVEDDSEPLPPVYPLILQQLDSPAHEP